MQTYPDLLTAEHQPHTHGAIKHRHASSVRVSDRNAGLSLIYELCQQLSEANVVYCHWKSNDALDRSATGDNDLDFLIRRADSQRFSGILYKLGFKEAQLPPTRRMPGVLDYYGLDAKSGSMVHVHAHYKLIVGEDMTKNVHLPLEKAYLASATQTSLFPTPAPDIELIVFVIRMMLKHATWDTALTGLANLSKAERRELNYLQERADITKVYARLVEVLPNISVELFARCLAALRPDTSLWQLLRAGTQLERALASQTRYGYWTDSMLKIGRRLKRGLQRRLTRLMPDLFALRKKTLTRGGALIAIVGGDGAGKTTAVDETCRWLAKQFDISRVHMGKPGWSRTTIVVRAVLKWARLVRGTGYASFAEVRYANKEARSFPGYALLLRELCTARDRYRTYARARRSAIHGVLVVCDRYPLPQIQGMDGPQILHLVPPQSTNWLVRLLARWEASYYRRILPPDVTIVLWLDPKIAVTRAAARGGSEDPAATLLRNQEIWQADWAQTSAHVIDARQPLERVLADVKHTIWSNI